ncbi:MAG: hypothetical protein FWG07_11045 [Treponema sp.]|nr:hypothetical protein [Treponema sp.]
MEIHEVLGKKLFLVLLLTAGTFFLSAQTLSGSLDTKITLGAGAGDSSGFFYGAEEYANLRLKVPAGEYATVYSAFNLIAAAGYSAAQIQAVSGTGMFGGYAMEENYAAIMELERLYVQISGDNLGLSAGLLRIPFGYGLVWGPMDFLNPRNPLEPDARFRGILGITASYFPEELPDMKFLVFAAAPKDPLTPGGNGARAGLTWDSHWQRASIQLLYCFESPASYTAYNPTGSQMSNEYPKGLHRAGFSFKADLELGFTAEFLYTSNPDKNTGINGLSASAGVDYSFYGGKLYLLAEYLFSGSESAEAKSAAAPSGHSGSHYLYTAGTWKWSDFSSVSLGCLANLNDISFIPVVSWQYEFIHGIVLSIRSYVSLDKDSFNAGEPGELGPRNSGRYFYIAAGLKVKF